MKFFSRFPEKPFATLFFVAVVGLTYAGMQALPEETVALVVLVLLCFASGKQLRDTGAPTATEIVPALARARATHAFFLRLTALALVLLSVALLNVFVPPEARLGDGALFRRSVEASFLMAFLPLGCCLSLRGWARRVLFAASYVAVLAPVLFLWGYFFLAHCWATADTVLAIAQTHGAEAAAFWGDQMGAGGTLFVLFLIAAALLFGRWLMRVPARPPRTLRKKLGALALAVLDVFVLVFFCASSNDFYVGRLGVESASAFVRIAEFQKHHAQHAETLAVIPQLAPGTGGVHVLVIGESQNRQYMHAYGGPEGTTPWLDAMKDSPACIVFRHAYSCHVFTVAALSYALTEKNQYNNIDETQAISLLEVAKAAGYRTAWLSNQGKNGAFDMATGIIASDAGRVHFLSDRQTHDNHHLDGELVAAFDETAAALRLTDDPAQDALIVVHLLGCHNHYADRYPKDGTFAAPFDSSTPAGAYENAVRYNDAVMQELYEHAKRLPGFRDLTFLSDHGEDLAHGAGHDPVRYEPDMTYIPFYIFYAPEAAAARPTLYQTLRANAAKPWTNDLLYELLITLLGVTPPHTIAPEDNIADPAYDGDIGRLRTCHGERKITLENNEAH